MNRFPVIGRYHLNRVPWAAIEKRTIGSFADALLTANAEIGIHFNTSERRMVFVGHPEHASFDWTVFDTSRRACATGAAVGGDGENAWPLFAGRLTVAL